MRRKAAGEGCDKGAYKVPGGRGRSDGKIVNGRIVGLHVVVVVSILCILSDVVDVVVTAVGSETRIDSARQCGAGSREGTLDDRVVSREEGELRRMSYQTWAAQRARKVDSPERCRRLRQLRNWG